MTPTAQQQLLEAARGGDRTAIEALLREEQGRLYRFGLKMCGDPEDAKEVLQDSLLAAARALPGFEGKSSLATWLYTIARSFCIKRRRHSKFLPAPAQSLEGEVRGEVARLADQRPLADQQVSDREMGDLVERGLRALEPEQREVLVLRDVDGLSAQDAASVLGIGVPALKSRLHRARAALRHQLAPALGELEPPESAACPDILTMFSAELEGEVTAEVCARVQQHLGGCRRCRQACRDLERVLALCQTTAPAVPADVQESVRRALQRALQPAR